MNPLLVSMKDAAKLLSLSPRTVWQLAKDDNIPTFKVGRRVMFPVADLELWIAQQRRRKEPRN